MDVGDTVQTIGIVIQAIAVGVTVVFAQRTVTEARAARREEGERFEREPRATSSLPRL